jgi:hypothetical protein
MTYCDAHCLMEEHIKEAPVIRSMVGKHETKLDNFDVWIPKIESKVDAIPKLLNEFYIKIMLSLSVVNIGTIVVLKVLEGVK